MHVVWLKSHACYAFYVWVKLGGGVLSQAFSWCQGHVTIFAVRGSSAGLVKCLAMARPLVSWRNPVQAAVSLFTMRKHFYVGPCTKQKSHSAVSTGKADYIC